MHPLAPRDGERIHCYAKRMLNPFRGIVNVIRYRWAEAVTTDGARWDIYVSNDDLLCGIDSVVDVQTSDIRYGSWHPDQGLKRGPIVPSDEFRRMEEMGAVVYEHLLAFHEDVPFPLTDRLELWLLDNESRPLALLNSEAWVEDIQNYQILEFRAGQDCRRHFSPKMPAGLENENAADALDRRINGARGPKAPAQWFHRRDDGAGEALGGHNIDERLKGRVLEASAFPAYYLRDPLPDGCFRSLIADYVRWQAPWFLLLDDLEHGERARFEQAARARAMKLDMIYRLIPELIEPAAIEAARVEARLRRALPPARDDDTAQSTFYIELNPGPSD